MLGFEWCEDGMILEADKQGVWNTLREEENEGKSCGSQVPDQPTENAVPNLQPNLHSPSSPEGGLGELGSYWMHWWRADAPRGWKMRGKRRTVETTVKCHASSPKARWEDSSLRRGVDRRRSGGMGTAGEGNRGGLWEMESGK